jgi:hypothetical protein
MDGYLESPLGGSVTRDPHKRPLVGQDVEAMCPMLLRSFSTRYVSASTLLPLASILSGRYSIAAYLS